VSRHLTKDKGLTFYFFKSDRAFIPNTSDGHDQAKKMLIVVMHPMKVIPETRRVH
jgi:hypothetical protein